MAGDERWYFAKEEINNSPSRKCGVDAEKESSYRLQAAKLIQDVGQRLHVPQLVINTAIVYMHRFYMFHTFTKFHRNSIAPAALFLAAKVEEHPRKLENVIKFVHLYCHHEQPVLDTQSEAYMEKAQELIMNENILLQTLGFDVAIDHPHSYVVKCFQIAPGLTDIAGLAQSSYVMATHSLHMTTMCLQYKPAVVACVCIYLTCRWSSTEIKRSSEGVDWFYHVDPTVTLEMLEMITSELLAEFDKHPDRLKKLMNSIPHGGLSSNSFGDERASRHSSSSLAMSVRAQSIVGPGSTVRNHDLAKSGSAKALTQATTTPKTVISHREYAEKREKERREREKDRERAEHREKHQFHPTLSSSASGASHPSSNTVAGHPTHTAHLRSQPPEGSIRKHADGRQPVFHSSSNRGSHPGLPYKEPSIKREVSSHRADERLEKPERTSDNSVDSVKYLNEKLKTNVDLRHVQNRDWTQSMHLEYMKDRKVEPIKKEIKCEPKEIKSEPKEIKSELKEIRPVERDHKMVEVPKPFEPKGAHKTESSVKVKIEKVESKEEIKVPSVDEVKPNNSFIFNNNNFSLRDFLNPTEMPPDEIFDDTEIDSKPTPSEFEIYNMETTHHKLKIPPLPLAGSQTAVPSPIPSASVKGSSSSKQSHESLHSNSGSTKTGSNKSNSNSTLPYASHSVGNHTSETLGNGVSSNSVSSGSQNLPPPSSRKKDKGRSPHSQSTHTHSKVKHSTPNIEQSSLLTTTKTEDYKQNSVKDSSAPLVQVLPKDPHSSVLLRGGNTISTSSLPPPPSSEKVGSHSQNEQPSALPVKVSSYSEVSKVDSSVNNRLSRPENCDVNIVVSAPQLNSSSLVISTPVKKHKHDHNRHKRKDKKKHKHKEKDKHKDKESKEHKEHKKLKKHKKHREKDKDREKDKEKLPPPTTPVKESSSRPLKITLLRNKGIYTPEGGTTTSAITPTTVTLTPTIPTLPEKETPTSSSSLDTPGRIKLTIPKSRLQGNTVPGSHGSSPRGIPPKGVTPTKVKLKIQKEHLKPEKPEKESRKREREKSPGDNVHPSKIVRSSSNYNTPQVLDSTRWTSQRH